ncbi:hypothetical protein AVEN_88501-1 [Araneus ventricosus]|uniref:Uncharacterized protein n=1 Tax=Araneus ventricosus TaxID=182803 RepID=A0A4Y2HR97_ARAVE|nr:hypothetical protein AVEN_88501-1 [Araneus ventricosus]
MSRLQPIGLPWLLNCCLPSPANFLDTLTLECGSLVKTSKIIEEYYNIIPTEYLDSTQVNHLRNERYFLLFEKLTASHLQHFHIYSNPLGFLSDF